MTIYCVVYVMCESGGYDGHIEFTAPRVADWVPPVKKGCREYGGGNGCNMSGGGVCVCVDRGRNGQPSAIPDKMCLRDREGEGH
jgi:hypothetical protein